MLISILVGLAAGMHIATWGMYKDAPHEGFTLPRYFRSIVIAGITAPLLALFLQIDLMRAGGLLLLFGLTYVAERALTEFWKTYIREEDQSKYFIPMQFQFRGRPVSRRLRLAVGAASIAFAAVLLVATRALLHSEHNIPVTAVVLVVGSLGGWYSALGGAWKDAPIEGFELLKFFRSPVLAATYALLLSPFVDSPVLLALAGLGYTIATLETYKTFFFPSKPRGKFAGKPVCYPAMLVRRQAFVPLYVTICAGVWTLFVWAYSALA